MKTRLLTLAFILCVLFMPHLANGAQAKGFTIPDSSTHTITSDTLGRTYDIYVKVPKEYHSDSAAQKRYPVIYLNDGPYTFQVASGVTHLPMNVGKLEKAIVVGLSFAEGENGMDSRVRDLTPTEDKGWTRYQTGGAPEYLTFLEKEVIPYVEKHYRADSHNRTLAGQSLGGSFGAWVLLTRPDLFDNYILTSGSYWYHDRVIFAMEERYAEQHKDLKARVYFAVGEYEDLEHRNTRNDMVGDQKALVAKLRSRGYPNLVIKDDIISEGLHETTFPIGFTRGVRWLFDKPPESHKP